MNLKSLQSRCHNDAVKMGWYDIDYAKSPVEAMMLVVTEIAEVVEELRKPIVEHHALLNGKKPIGVAPEIADAIIRLLDFAGSQGYDMEKVIEEKLNYNLTRGIRHGKKF